MLAHFEPDGIGVLENGSGTWLVTANEGDPREFEDARVGELVLDPSAFPQAAMLQREDNLGRLRVTRVEGDTDGDGDYDRLYTLGTRSFSIWTTGGQLIFDSGDAFERNTAEAVPSSSTRRTTPTCSTGGAPTVAPSRSRWRSAGSAHGTTCSSAWSASAASSPTT